MQGNSLTSEGSGGQQSGVVSANFRNIQILDNTISAGGNGHILIYSFNAPTNVPGRVVLGNNIYAGRDNISGGKWIRISNLGPSLVTATTNLGNYVVTDLNPGPF